MHYIYDITTGKVVGSTSDRSVVENSLKDNWAILTRDTPLRGPLKYMTVVNNTLTINLGDHEAELVRARRDELLADTDWWASQDRTMTSAQARYRQDLRDIPAQAGFPTNVTWPTKP